VASNRDAAHLIDIINKLLGENISFDAARKAYAQLHGAKEVIS
jgi:transposase